MGFFKKHKVTAKAEGHALTVCVPAGEGCKLWRAALDKFATAAFEIKELRGQHVLVLSSAGHEEEIASFETKKQAEKALCAIAGALVPCKGGWLRKTVKVFVVLLALFGLLTLWSGSPERPVPPKNTSVQSPGVRSGVPVPADELFK